MKLKDCSIIILFVTNSDRHWLEHQNFFVGLYPIVGTYPCKYSLDDTIPKDSNYLSKVWNVNLMHMLSYTTFLYFI